MVGSITCATKAHLKEWGFSPKEVTTLSKQWYRATISCLNEAEYMANPDIYSIHAITTLAMSAHPLGHSQELAVLLDAASKIAQGLGLNRLSYDKALENITSSSQEEQRHKLLKREIGRRLWSFLCINDWMSVPFAEAHTIHPLHFTTIKPANRDHLSMESITPSFPTYVSYGNYLYEIAKLMISHHEAMLRATTQLMMYESVMEYDSRIRTLAINEIPRYFHVVEPIDPAWPQWIVWARRSLTICFAHKVIMIHRAFIRQSFTNPAYSFTRTTCLAASATILKEAKQTKDLDGPIIWVDKAFCIVAGIIFCLDIFHRSGFEAEFQTHRELVIDCITLLQKSETSAIAARGATLLSALISARDRLTSESAWPTWTMKMSDIFESLTKEQDSQYAPTSLELEGNLLADILPPQAGFCNRFLFDDLLYKII
ncbi:uncharacterized protein N7443_007231 [Penicillium atrosanguineum]|uniref:uncharacterized protein n=1 Tax=Penicillium atrosanguineum TaxID=1132637 RepID=UPI0023903B03|nr:uncharacterized protein N7443_007231 [Penicillium atrosanguineum]KAJ5296338.1 hypothetical protein N7443_007231 [Penicillium atrosanguineum]